LLLVYIKVLKFIGFFEGAKIFETKLIHKGRGITLPNFGIFLSPRTYSLQKDLWLVKHEFGHFLQYQEIGFIKFYIKIGISSLFSAVKQNLIKDYDHQTHKVELDANKKSYLYFNQPSDWPLNRFPII